MKHDKPSRVFLAARVPDDLRRRVRIAAIRRGVTLAQLVQEALAAFLDGAKANKGGDDGTTT